MVVDSTRSNNLVELLTMGLEIRAFPLAATFFNFHASPRLPFFEALGADWSRRLETRRGIDFHLQVAATVLRPGHCPHHENVSPKRLTGLRPSFKEVVEGVYTTAFGHALTPGRPILAAPNPIQLAPEAEVVPPSVIHGINIWKRVFVQGARPKARPDGNSRRLVRSRLSARDWALNVVGG
ncbi:hypothetical protein CFIO01_07722 [Colletotrichum fioriniae PJ7]|uniref:Uncharacterized protein n=1 Tax=Colletotrichum fioriniae PJ7 TaxID=1445577 RepID=A0A010RTU7_9PEZI|nr:hypothetical protein CFIO01_07722 [Colletotrichum fioriniae PJ7]